MFGRRSPAARITTVDRAFDEAATNARSFGRTAAEHIAREYRAGKIDAQGIDALVELALEQTAGEARDVPKAMLRQILQTLHGTIRQELAAAGIEIAELPT